mmetsp:Transcript_28760/g.69246  ORF Transcript_28760/g.69246 Transcript_28760/m.69246 type:complete len:248 (+) Transcript_28760:947-1690(+)
MHAERPASLPRACPPSYPAAAFRPRRISLLRWRARHSSSSGAAASVSTAPRGRIYRAVDSGRVSSRRIPVSRPVRVVATRGRPPPPHPARPRYHPSGYRNRPIALRRPPPTPAPRPRRACTRPWPRRRRAHPFASRPVPPPPYHRRPCPWTYRARPWHPSSPSASHRATPSFPCPFCCCSYCSDLVCWVCCCCCCCVVVCPFRIGWGWKPPPSPADLGTCAGWNGTLRRILWREERTVACSKIAHVR